VGEEEKKKKSRRAEEEKKRKNSARAESRREGESGPSFSTSTLERLLVHCYDKLTITTTVQQP
jgi:hypothetical protein